MTSPRSRHSRIEWMLAASYMLKYKDGGGEVQADFIKDSLFVRPIKGSGD